MLANWQLKARKWTLNSHQDRFARHFLTSLCVAPARASRDCSPHVQLVRRIFGRASRGTVSLLGTYSNHSLKPAGRFK